MTANEDNIHKFYSAFSKSDTATMFKLYAPNVRFMDPIFGSLTGNDVFCMWSMLIDKGKGKMHIEVTDIRADEFMGSAKWTATYQYSAANRKVVNVVNANFQFKDGLIIKHTDEFDIWKWSRQALGLSGALMGWTGFMQQKIQEKALLSLLNYKLHQGDKKHTITV
ncbi:nuclear transport factor 2 family protein [Flavobacterium algicola]|uniref:nuclear transport factor 2 family protein n=1 Tax=Flavobacterium algicola TaxID=556529 RepID=UPI001EFCE3D3|nr:nuclear transport factor 2 family protein [Flavobacterium algicola]MCG9792718.1 nuclear transport factor 2 family protein [Flavobacterium algicola]